MCPVRQADSIPGSSFVNSSHVGARHPCLAHSMFLREAGITESYPCLPGRVIYHTWSLRERFQAEAAGGRKWSPWVVPWVWEDVQTVWYKAAAAYLLHDTYEACKPRTHWLMLPPPQPLVGREIE